MLIRALNLSDREVVEDLITQHVAEVGYVETEFNEELLQSSEDFWKRLGQEGYGYWGVEINQELVAIGGCRPLSEAQAQVGEIQHVYVKPAFRGRGIGAELLQKIIEEASQHYSRLYIETHHKLNKANRLFEHFGFKQIPYALTSHAPFEMDCWYVKEIGVPQATN
ncbi:GNAT family N-acetyltransferase [Vagococcus zengguangii]|uniref:GNAT family N-acetyltransferase n=1 Tax=Vagococcus zengguangii TaxID=2571750 RepID=A0A4D7CSN9_9ENTE|nr:GNAT family N-acetyltransferase [Vagococcus zengguangii]QCI85944.1 GNAT family N-acetyltransferase [Vagococcus zengguangii]TLG80311.1 GNAT family N-acetyltransferase [Vagococcus zengguangii]